MKINKIMIAGLILLAVLTLGAVSASDNLTASETPDLEELGVSDADIIEESDVGDEIDESNVLSADDGRQEPEMKVSLPDDTKVGEAFTVDVTLSEDAEGVIEYDFEQGDDETESYGFDSSLLSYGKNDIAVSYNGDDVFAENSSSATINSESHFEIPDDIQFGSSDIKVLELPGDATGNITVYYDDYQNPVARGTVENGVGRVNFTGLAVDSYYNHFFKYEGNYDGITGYYNFTITPRIAIPWVVVQGEDAYVVVEVQEGLEGIVNVSYVEYDEATWDKPVFKIGSAQFANGVAKVSLSGLEIGNYIVHVCCDGDSLNFENDYHLYVVENNDFYFNVSCSFEDIRKDDDNYYVTRVSVSLPKFADGSISFIIDGVPDRKIPLDGSTLYIYNIDAKALDCGNHTLEVRYTSDQFENRSEIIKFNIVPIDIHIPDEIQAWPKDDMWYRSVSLSYYPNTAGRVTVLLDGKEYATYDLAKNPYGGSIPIINVSVRSYNVTVIYSGDDTYPGMTVSKMVNMNYTLPISRPDYFVYGDENRVQIHMPPDIGGGNLIATIDGKNYEITHLDNGNYCEIDVSDLAIGNHTLTVKYAGDEIYPELEVNESIPVLPEIHIPYGWAADEKVRLVLPGDAQGKLLVNVSSYTYEFDLDIGDERKVYTPVDYKEIPLVDGKAEYSLDNLTIGEYYIECSYSGSDYEVCDNKQDFTMCADIYWDDEFENGNCSLPIDKGATIFIETPGFEGKLAVMVKQITDYYWNEAGDVVYITDTVLEDSVALVDGKANYTISGLKRLGTHFVYAEYVADGETADFKGCFGEIKVVPIEVNLPDSSKDLNGKSPGSISVRMPEDTNGSLEFRITRYDEDSMEWEDCYINITQFKNGLVTIDLNELEEGDYVFYVGFTGNHGGYSKTSDVVHVFVKKSPNVVDPRIVADQTAAMYTAKYSVTVYGKDGKAASGASVVFKINGVKVKTVTADSNGVASFNIPNKYVPKKYTITATALGKSASKTVAVKQILTMKAFKLKKSAKKVVVKVTVKKVNGKYINAKKYLRLKINGKTIKPTSFKKGIAKFTIKKSVLKKLKVNKKYVCKVTYMKTSVSKKVKVKR